VLDLSVKTGSDCYYIGKIPFHAVAKATHVSPRTGPRAGKTQVMVEGDNFINSTHLICKFRSELGPSVKYISSAKVLCISRHFPTGYGRALVPVQVANNGVDFTAASDTARFEFHEPLVVKEASPLIGLSKGGTVINITLAVQVMRFEAVQNENSVVIVRSIASPYGPEIGGNLVTVHGSGFTPNQFTACKFGDIQVSAVFISEESLECIAPQASDIDQYIDITLTIDGADKGSQPYTYLPMA
jgi:hypothetical protein